MNMRFLFPLLLSLAGFSFASTPELDPGWGTEPVERSSPSRARICLNGLWNFCPDASQPLPAIGDAAWGLKHVPGAWANGHWNMQLRNSIHRFGRGPRWELPRWQQSEFRELESAWYRRSLELPADWAGSAIILDFERISTDAVVFIDGKKAGEVRWPGGEVDISSWVKPGEPAELSMQVLSTTADELVLNFMATADSQVSAHKATLHHRGIIGDVFVQQRPQGLRIQDVFIQPSVRKKQLQLDILPAGLPAAKELPLSIRILDEKGNEVMATSGAQAFQPGHPSVVTLPWADPLFWDFGEPNFYSLEIRLGEGDQQDVFRERFGFKEFWIEGRQFYLNGRAVALRPINVKDGHASGNPALIRNHIRRYMELGFNVGELWPSDHLERGSGHFRKLWKEIADEEGFGLIATLPRSNRYIMDSRWRYIWDEKREQYAQDLMPELIDFRNHPSVLYWVNSANFFGHHQDQNPRHLGRNMEVNPSWHQKEAAGLEAIAFIKAADPTRPVATHQGAQVGDVFMTNFYLNLLPLQDRMEWLSDYVENGTMPFMPVEMGTPLDCSFRRGRNGFSKNTKSEPLMTEYLAIYQGAEAYLSEPEAYRKDLADTYQGDQLYGWWQNKPSKISAPGFQELQVLFTTQTYRSWRSWGNSAGMIAWADAHGWGQGPGAQQRVASAEPFQPGHRGTWLPSIERFKTAPFSQEAGWIQFPAGKALEAHNQPSLAYIAGAPDFTDRSHNYRSGGVFSKQIVVINDLASTQPIQLNWSLRVGDEILESRSETHELAPSKQLRRPIELKLQAVTEKTDAELILEAQVGKQHHTDRFAFRVFPKAEPMRLSAKLEDPKGKSSAMLKAAGIRLDQAEGIPSLKIIGREALGRGQGLTEADQEILKAGGTVLIMIQERAWYERVLGFRVADPISRHVYPVQAAHPLTTGLDAQDLRNWNSHSTLIEAYPVLTKPDTKLGAYGVPYYGWRWGSRGGVSSAMLEKPHFSGWTPILEGEFDLAYSPLMELQSLGGRIILCSLDLEDAAASDPAAAQLSRQLLSYAASALPSPAQPTVYIGDDDGAARLRDIGLRFRQEKRLPTEAGLLLVGQDSGLNLEALRDYAEQGKRVLILPQSSESSPLKLMAENISGKARDLPPWPELRGVSLSELRTRARASLKLLEPQEGLERGAGGLLGRLPLKQGHLISLQLDPDALNAEQKSYQRFTRWRFHRAQSQVISNLGGRFDSDARIFRSVEALPDPISLAGDWEYRMLHTIPDPDQRPHGDPGMTAETQQLLEAGKALKDDLGTSQVPGMILDFNKLNGEALLQRRFSLSSAMAAQELELHLGTLDDQDITYINGVQVGKTEGWNLPRVYRVPADILKEGENLIQIRLWDNFGGGGAGGTPAQFRIGLPEPEAGRNLYHADYISEFPMGDDPYRYYRW